MNNNYGTVYQPYSSKYRPDTPILSQAEKDKAIAEEIAKRKAAEAERQAKFLPKTARQFSSLHEAGRTTAASGRQVGGIIGDAGKAAYDGLVGGYKGLYDLAAPVGEGIANYGRGVLGMGEDTEEGFRYANQQNPQPSPQDDNAAPPALTQGGAEPTTHTMPDGTVMEGATHEAYLQANQPALDLQDEYGNLGAEFGDEPLVPGQEGYVAPVEDRSVPSGVLSQRLQTLGQMDAVNQPDNTSRKRDKGMSGENLMRIGGAIMGGSSRGNMAAMSAGLAKYGELKDYGREQEQLGLERDAALAEAERKQKAAQAEVDAERFGSPAEIYAAQELTGKIDGLMADLSNPDFNAVGASKNFLFNKLGAMAGTDEASIRLRLQELVVDKTLSNTAFTKGAISDKEMKLFRSDIPEFSSAEKVWLKWLKDYGDATRMLEHNLRTGYAPFKEQNAGRQYSGASGGDINMSADDEDVFNSI